MNRLLEKAILFLLRRYVARNGIFHNYSLSFDDKDFLYCWVSHDRAKIVYDALIKAIEKSRTRPNFRFQSRVLAGNRKKITAGSKTQKIGEWMFESKGIKKHPSFWGQKMIFQKTDVRQTDVCADDPPAALIREHKKRTLIFYQGSFCFGCFIALS